MTLDVVLIKVDRKTGVSKNMGVIGTKEILNDEYREGCVNYLTGLSTMDCVKAIREYYKEEKSIRHERTIK